MNNNRDCKIVQDLLPNYIEKLTTTETNQFIEEHLKQCKECKNIVLNMENELKIKDAKREKNEVKYIKKYNQKLRFFKIIVLLIFIIFIASITRKMIIISDLNKKANKYLNSPNYYEKIIAYNGENMLIHDIYCKGDKTVTIMRRITENETNKITWYKKEGKTNIYWDNENQKIAEINSNGGLQINIVNYLQANNLFELLIASITTNIKSVEYNGKECYIVTNYFGPNVLLTESEGAWIEKDTGLMIKNTGGMGSSFGTVTNFKYEFGSVTDDIFIEPDISEYKVK